MKKSASLTITLILSMLLSTAGHAELSLAVYPWKNTEATYTQFKPLTEQLANQLGERIRLILSKDREAFWQELQNGKFDIVLFEQHHYLQVIRTLPYELLAAAEKKDLREDKSVLVVSSESTIKTIRDLKGKRLIVAKDPQDLSGYLLPIQLIKTSGLKQDRDYQLLYSMEPYLSLEKIVRNNQIAAGISESALNQLTHANSVFASKIRLLATTQAFPTFHCWAIKSTLPDELRLRVRAYFVGISASNEPGNISEVSGYARTYPITLKDLDNTAQLLSGK